MAAEPHIAPWPWTLLAPSLDGYGTIRDAEGGSVAAIAWRGKPPHLESRSHALLLTAAPDLYSALEKAEDFLAGFEDDASQDGVGELLADVRAALTRARTR